MLHSGDTFLLENVQTNEVFYELTEVYTVFSSFAELQKIGIEIKELETQIEEKTLRLDDLEEEDPEYAAIFNLLKDLNSQKLHKKNDYELKSGALYGYLNKNQSMSDLVNHLYADIPVELHSYADALITRFWLDSNQKYYEVENNLNYQLYNNVYFQYYSSIHPDMSFDDIKNLLEEKNLFTQELYDTTDIAGAFKQTLNSIHQAKVDQIDEYNKKLADNIAEINELEALPDQIDTVLSKIANLKTSNKLLEVLISSSLRIENRIKSLNENYDDLRISYLSYENDIDKNGFGSFNLADPTQPEFSWKLKNFLHSVVLTESEYDHLWENYLSYGKITK